MNIRKAKSEDLADLTGLIIALWPECNYSEEYEHCRELLSSENDQYFLACERSETVGFIHMSLRYEYVEGAESLPIGYIEGIYLHPDHRSRGIGKQLVSIGEKWAKEKGCSQIASDAEVKNEKSILFHKGVGFKEVNRIVCFIKDLG